MPKRWRRLRALLDPSECDLPGGGVDPDVGAMVRRAKRPGGIRKYLGDIHLLGYCPRGDVIADAAVFLLSDKARFITGCILPVSGGAELGYRR